MLSVERSKQENDHNLIKYLCLKKISSGKVGKMFKPIKASEQDNEKIDTVGARHNRMKNSIVIQQMVCRLTKILPHLEIDTE
ncbi:unnamed protein product [Hymenolepis diminuta]|uniref:Uncharacterized protein n=1 Tax=Hymenolepis diminuta TaxID=6216 RepID=A0A564YZC8_HYMDI|nr:unnamed protein product [Hymenolepis diminuta]